MLFNANADDANGLRDVWKIIDTHATEILDELRRTADDTDFAPFSRALAPVDPASAARASRRFLKQVLWGDTDAYEADLRERATRYAKAGIRLGSWYAVVAAVQRRLADFLVEAFACEPNRLLIAMDAIQRLIDRALAIVGQEYVKVQTALLSDLEKCLEGVLDSGRQLRSLMGDVLALAKFETDGPDPQVRSLP